MGDKKEYSTRQRQQIMDFFRLHQDECFSARYIIESGSFDLGEATAYRLLSRLAAEGRLKRFIADKGEGATYQYNNAEQCDGHFHLKCLSCGETICMDCPFMSELGRHVRSEHGFSVDNTKTILFGNCKKCRGGQD